ncbi:thioredoxin [Cytophagaceae bacterium DM2B3-1]|uniref:Thioredoxin n=1 Tax=Xanthocytophaga flava TaxID=3048013 RepID=A0AAE3QTH6_9BACT|nr:thioredoxin [Xanthocytophaga flavus]MDJ1473523.1 thioredoxin [Xanthocytophaga flavus]MDJ1482378.1 thioredoxin [Xanthocytophaga flavus]MDJ1491937.1 thioredoxin [Xanthocytophaga flavus]
MSQIFTDANFQKEVLESDQLTVIDFNADWCGPCRSLSPVIDALSKDYEGKVNIGKVNVDQNPALSAEYGIRSIPAVLFIKGGKVVDRQLGAVPKTVLDQKIQLHLS